MSYTPITDFLGLLRAGASSSEQLARMPGLDYVVSALARAGLFSLSVGQTAPTSNQSTTVWLKPSVPSWVAEGTVFLWNGTAYVAASAALWSSLLASSGYSFQSAAQASNIINVGSTLVAVQRANPIATTLILPNLAAQWLTGRKLQIIDFSTGLTGQHAISLITPDGATIMQLASWQIVSTPDQLAGITLQPSPELNSWIIAP